MISNQDDCYAQNLENLLQHHLVRNVAIQSWIYTEISVLITGIYLFNPSIVYIWYILPIGPLQFFQNFFELVTFSAKLWCILKAKLCKKEDCSFIVLKNLYELIFKFKVLPETKDKPTPQ